MTNSEKEKVYLIQKRIWEIFENSKYYNNIDIKIHSHWGPCHNPEITYTVTEACPPEWSEQGEKNEF